MKSRKSTFRKREKSLSVNHERTGCNVIIERVTTIIEVEILYIFVKVFVLFDGNVQYFTVIFCLLGGFKW